MKVLKKTIASAMLLIFLFSTTSCIVLVPTKRHDNGKHKGWYKNPKNPHNPSSDKKKDKKHR